MQALLRKVGPSPTDMIRADHTRVIAAFHRYKADSAPARKHQWRLRNIHERVHVIPARSIRVRSMVKQQFHKLRVSLFRRGRPV